MSYQPSKDVTLYPTLRCPLKPLAVDNLCTERFQVPLPVPLQECYKYIRMARNEHCNSLIRVIITAAWRTCPRAIFRNGGQYKRGGQPANQNAVKHGRFRAAAVAERKAAAKEPPRSGYSASVNGRQACP